MIKNKEKNKGYTKEFRNDDPTTALSHIDQQKAMLLDTIDDAKQKPKKRVVEPIEIPEIISLAISLSNCFAICASLILS